MDPKEVRKKITPIDVSAEELCDDIDALADEVDRLRELLERFRDYASKEGNWHGGAHHNPIWAEVAAAIAALEGK